MNASNREEREEVVMLIIIVDAFPAKSGMFCKNADENLKKKIEEKHYS
tara:strand:- start:1547 stop:1690 length:144 start_codon:yes stop_codon:yes gene_type:complete